MITSMLLLIIEKCNQMKYLLFLLGFNMFFAQNKSFVFELKYKPNELKDSLKTEKTILDIDGKKAIFRTVKEKENDSISATKNMKTTFNFGFSEQFRVEKDHNKEEIFKIFRNGNDCYSLKIDEKLNWKIIKDKKKIGDFICQKAETNYGGRKWIAWFTEEIPLQEGPYIFCNLPGFITEISDDKENFHFVLIQIKKSSDVFSPKQKHIPLNWKSLEKLELQFYQDPYKDLKPNSAGSQFNIVVFTDENGNKFTPDFNEWTAREQKKIRENNNPLELNHKIFYNK